MAEPRTKRALAGAIATLAASLSTIADATVSTEVILQDPGATIILYNDTDQFIDAHVRYEFRCADGEGGTALTWIKEMSPRSRADLPVARAGCRMVWVRPLRPNYGPSDRQQRINQSNAYQAQRNAELEAASREEARQRARCNMTEQGSYRVEDVKYGRIPNDCYRRYPFLKRAADGARAADTAAASRAVNERLAAVEERNRRDNERRAVEAGLARQREQEDREIRAHEDKLRRASERAAAADELSRHEMSEYARIGALYADDPCRGADVLRGRPPDLSSASEGGSRVLMDNKVREWEMQIDVLDRRCRRDGDARATAARANAEAGVKAADDQRPRAAAEARATQSREAERSQRVVQDQQRSTEAQRSETERLRKLLEQAK